MSFVTTFTNLKAKAYDVYGKDPAKMLLHTGAWGWILSSAAQITGVAVNDKISAEEKKFLIPQEMADAAVNIASFYTITLGATKFGEKLITTGRIIIKPVEKFVKKAIEESGNKIKLGNFNTNIEDLVKNDFEIKKAYYGSKTGVKVIASTIGAVISSNIITPYLRNHIGANAQKRSLKKAALVQLQPVKLPYRMGIDDYKKQASSRAIYSTGSSSLKI